MAESQGIYLQPHTVWQGVQSPGNAHLPAAIFQAVPQYDQASRSSASLGRAPSDLPSGADNTMALHPGGGAAQAFPPQAGVPFPAPLFTSNSGGMGSVTTSLQLPSPIFKGAQPWRVSVPPLEALSTRPSPSRDDNVGPSARPMRVEDLVPASAPASPSQAFFYGAPPNLPAIRVALGADGTAPCAECAQAAARAARWAAAGLAPPRLPAGPARPLLCPRCSTPGGGGGSGARSMAASLLAHLDDLRASARLELSPPRPCGWLNAPPAGRATPPPRASLPPAVWHDRLGSLEALGSSARAADPAPRPARGPSTPSRILGSTSCLADDDRGSPPSAPY